MTSKELFDKFRQEAVNKKEQGGLFEKFTQKYLTQSREYKAIYDKVWLWADFPYKDGADTGIDLVAKYKNEDKYTAIQCKFFDENTAIHKSDIDSFISCSGKSFQKDGKAFYFSDRMIVTTASKWGANVDSALQKQFIPAKRIDFNTFMNDEDIVWDDFIDIKDMKFRRSYKELRLHQKDAVNSIKKGFEEADRGKLIMACGTGKTFTALKLAEDLCGAGGSVLFLAPSISLVSQTIGEWLRETSVSIGCIPVCSDTGVGRKDDDSLNETLSEFRYTASTNSCELVKRYCSMPDTVMKTVFSTYQSIEAVHEAQSELGFEFDLIICDEAHRTTGAKLSNQDESAFIRIHDGEYIKGKKRLYMTATPKVYGENVKKKADDANAVLCSMDDESIYGREFYRLGFGKAVADGLLTDYKVMILTVSESYIYNNFKEYIKEQQELDDYGKVIGVWNALSKRQILDGSGYTEINDPDPMKRAVAFTGTINGSKEFIKKVGEFHEKHYDKKDELVTLEADHIDGTMNNIERNKKIENLKKTPDDNVCKILSNARCLSEGIDVPSLDAVIFLAPRNSMVDIVQSVGRVMRSNCGKKYGYIVLPVVVPDDIPPEQALDDNQRYRVVWDVLQALRSHDDKFESVINALKFDKRSNKILTRHISEPAGNMQITTHDLNLETAYLHKLSDCLYNKIVQKCGDKLYWEQWAGEVASLARIHIKAINEILERGGDVKPAFDTFVNTLRSNLNEAITEADAVEMISQHLITRPVFEALFSSYSFVRNNPVSKAIDAMLISLDSGGGLLKGSDKLDRFYESVRKKAAAVKSREGKQKMVLELYDKFFRLAFKDVTEKLGIVYTPVEAVDFIIRAVNDALKKHFGRTLADRGVHIIDPFTGTGTFITRLLQSGLIGADALEYKYKHEIHANEIVLLAYYIAAINIEETYHSLSGADEYTPFEGIVLTDTFQLAETQGTLIDINEKNYLEENSSRLIKQKNAPIKVIIGNPPYSVGQKSANDDNKNTRYPKLEQAIADTYVKHSSASNKNSLYDSYVKAFRWATDRLDDDGVICFITNGGYIDNAAFNGFRKCISDDFSYVYCYNVRGNQNTQGEVSRREGGKLFGSGSRAGIAITLLIRDKSRKGDAEIYYHDIGDYLTREEKLNIISKSDINTLDWERVTPDKNNDWINKRNDEFETYIPLGDKKNKKSGGGSASVCSACIQWGYKRGKTLGYIISAKAS